MLGCLPVYYATSGMIFDRLESCTCDLERASTSMTWCIMQVLKFYNLEGQSKWLNLLYETCFLFLFLVLAWWATHSPLRSTVAHPPHAHHLLHAWLNISTCSFATDMEVAAGHCGCESATNLLNCAGLG